MSEKATTKWLTVCLHYNEPWEDFLSKAVKPYIDVVMQTGVAERFYFRRSWERGPHIRLWFKGNSDILENMLLPNLKEHFLQYFESRPSLLVDPQYPADFPEEYKWFPNNSVHFFIGEAELCRFGGGLQPALCEKQCQASSKIVLNILKNKKGKWNYNEMISQAIKLHLGFAYAAGLNMEETQQFFEWLLEEWVKKREKNEVVSRDQAGIEATLNTFHKIFEIQKKDIVPYHAALWELFKNFRKAEDKKFVKWIYACTSTSLELSLALESGKLLPLKKAEENPEKALWSFYEEFISLTNNQLGVTNKNEGYLFYLISQSMRIAKIGMPSFTKVEI